MPNDGLNLLEVPPSESSAPAAARQRGLRLLSLESLQEDDELLRLADVPKIPCLRKIVDRCTIHRWAVKGVRGMKLPVVRIGGVLHTSRRTVMLFIEQLTTGDADRQKTEAEATQKFMDDAAECAKLGL